MKHNIISLEIFFDDGESIKFINRDFKVLQICEVFNKKELHVYATKAGRVEEHYVFSLDKIFYYKYSDKFQGNKSIEKFKSKRWGL